MDFIANKTLINFLPMAGFKRQRVDSDRLYFTNKDGNQIKVDLRSKDIFFINSKGFTIKETSVTTDEELLNF